MGIGLSGVEAWSGEQLEPGTYRMVEAGVESCTSSNGNPQAKVTWRVDAGSYRGADQRDYVTFTEKALGRVVQILEAAGIATPAEEFASYEAMRDWFAGAIKGKTVEAIVRLKPGRADPSKEWPEIIGYRVPSTSDIPGDPVGQNAPATGDGKKLPF